MSQICKSCQYSNLDIAIYCANCGTKFIVEEEQKETVENENINTKLSNQIKIWILNGIVFIIVLFIFLNTFTTKDKHKNYNYQDVSLIEEKAKIGNEATKQEIKTHIIKDKDGTIISGKKIKHSNNEFLNDLIEEQKQLLLQLQKVTNISSSSSQNISSKRWECNIEWIIDKGKKFKPTNENLQTLSIELIDGADKLHLKTQNGESIYNYESFIDLKDNNLGMHYTYGDRFIGIFQDKTLFLGDSKRDRINAKYYCKDMVLDITKSTSSKTHVKRTQKEPKNILTHKGTKKIVIPIKKFSLSVQTTPSDARVRILNIKPKYHDGIKLKKGKYHIEVSKRGYSSDSGWIELEEDTNLNITLDRIPQVIQYTKPITTPHIVKKISRKKPNMSHLPRETKKVIENACTTEKYSGGASKYFSCIQNQINILGNRKKPNMSHLPRETRKVIENACTTEKYSGGASKYFSCIQTQLNQL